MGLPPIAMLVVMLAAGPGAPASPVAHAASGHIVAAQVASKTYGRKRLVWIRTPANYDAKKAGGYDLVIAFDGSGYLDEMPLPRTLDSLEAAGRIAPTVAVLVDDSTGGVRLADLANQPRFVRFLAEELLPWVRQRWRVSTDPHRATLTGSSAGGLAAAYVAFQRPDLFGNVLSQSGAFWRGAAGSNDPPWEWLTRQIESTPKRDVRFVLDVGSQETAGTLNGRAPSILAATRRLRDALQAKGYTLAYTEVEGGVHHPDSWRLRLPVGLAAAAGH